MTRTPAHPTTPKLYITFLKICKRLGFPNFFIEDFLNYQKNRNWILNGKRIKNPAGAFTNWAKARRENMILNNTWHGSKNENWEYTPAVFFGFKKPKDRKTENYIKTLIYKISHAETMTQQENEHAAQMGIYTEIERLEEDFKNDNPDESTTPKNIYRIECEICGFKTLSYEKEKKLFCSPCGKMQDFKQITKKDFKK